MFCFRKNFVFHELASQLESTHRSIYEPTSMSKITIFQSVLSPINSNLTSNIAEWMFTFNRKQLLNESYFNIGSGFGDGTVAHPQVKSCSNFVHDCMFIKYTIQQRVSRVIAISPSLLLKLNTLIYFKMNCVIEQTKISIQ